jgi:hypothetical protein
MIRRICVSENTVLGKLKRRDDGVSEELVKVLSQYKFGRRGKTERNVEVERQLQGQDSK